MSWESGTQPITPLLVKGDIFKELEKFEGETLDNEQAKYFLGKLFKTNIGFAWELLTEQILFPFQELILNGLFRKDKSVLIAGRGLGKSYMLAIYSLMYALYVPDSKIVIVASVYRRVKDIFLYMEKFLSYKEAHLLRECFDDKIKKDPDQYILKCKNGSMITGLPLGGELLRGQRASVLIVDEGLLISPHIQETILYPFLTARQNVKEQLETKQKEDTLIQQGLITEEDRTIFPNNKLIITSSASFKFEYLYEGIYNPWTEIILKDAKSRPTDLPSYFVTRMSYLALDSSSPIMADSVLAGAREGKEQTASYQREYCARFVDGSEGYFDMKKLLACTVPDGELPTTQIKGNAESEYILAIDPAYGASLASDYFAFGVFRIEPETKRITQVHSYGKSGQDVRTHYEYLIYILKNFNIVFLVIDSSGTEFISGFNQSVLAQEHRIDLQFIEADFEQDGIEYVKELIKAKGQINKEGRRFCYAQKFSGTINPLLFMIL